MSEETNYLRKAMEMAEAAQRLNDEVKTAAQNAGVSISAVREALSNVTGTNDLDQALASAGGAVRLNNELKEKTEEAAAKVQLMKETLKLAEDLEGASG